MSSSLIYSTIVFHALPLRALFLCPQPCHQPPVFERVAEPSFLPVAVMGKGDFPKKRPKWAPFFSVFSVWRTQSSPALICVAIHINALKTRLTRHSLDTVMEKTSSKITRICLRDAKQSPPHLAVMCFE